MASKRTRMPRSRSLFLVIDALHRYVPSSTPVTEHRQSEAGVPNLRYLAETGGIPWQVDIYQGQFFRARVGSAMGDVLRSIPALIGYLHRHLGIVADRREGV